MVSAEHEPITGVWGRSPQRGPGAQPLVRGSGGRSPPEAENIGLWMSNGAGRFSPFPKMSFYPYRKQYALLRSTGVRVGGPDCMVPPTPSLGPVPPGPRLHRLCKLQVVKVT